MREKQNVEI